MLMYTTAYLLRMYVTSNGWLKGHIPVVLNLFVDDLRSKKTLIPQIIILNCSIMIVECSSRAHPDHYSSFIGSINEYICY